ncbi:Flagellin [Rubrivivax sp. A210]|uniref:flagellar hook-associated protein FlgL n=1 Tax=Rubrivivax sp. A210 TaxID=2772301 RepID=UPI00191A0EE8|nr:flagellar hook-associated protein FlgL [Rubrivivax sp. A210]CAD5374739.1 Flagellin [Rubrivivax sp. A210]
MRITSAHAFETSVSNLQRRQQGISEAQDRLTSGKRVQKVSDDPSSAAAAIRALAASRRVDAEQRALGASRNAMLLTESALGDAGELLQQARETVMNAGNGGYSDSERALMADKLEGLRDDLLKTANRGDGAGRYLFGGKGADVPPIAANGLTYNGTAGQAQAASGEPSPLSMDGQAVWLSELDQALPGSTIFAMLDRTVTELRTAGRTTAEITQTVADGLGFIDKAQEHLGGWRARAGETLNRIDGIASRLGQGKLDAERQLSEAEDLDMLQAISEFQNRQSGYDAALKTYSIVQRLSLFDYVR